MLKYNIFRGLTVISALALLAPGTIEEAEAKIGMKIGYPTTADPQHDYAVKFVNEVRKRTNGEIDGKVFPTSQLGKIPRQIEGMGRGAEPAHHAA